MKDVLKQAQDLLKVAKENPQQFEELTKASKGAAPKASPERTALEKRTMENQRKADLRDKKIKKSDIPAADQGGEISSEKKPSEHPDMQKDAMPATKPAAAAPMHKDDKPHPPQSAPAEAHNVAEGDESLHHALKILDTPEKQKAMLAHLHTIHGPQQERSPANRVAGGVPAQKPAAPAAPAPAMKAEDILNQAKVLLKAAKDDPKKFEELTKAFGAPAPAGAPAAPKAPGMAKPAMPKPAGAGPKPPGMGQPAMPKPAGMRMSKEEIKADLAKPWKPKHMKQGC